MENTVAFISNTLHRTREVIVGTLNHRKEEKESPARVRVKLRKEVNTSYVLIAAASIAVVLLLVFLMSAGRLLVYMEMTVDRKSISDLLQSKYQTEFEVYKLADGSTEGEAPALYMVQSDLGSATLISKNGIVSDNYWCLAHNESATNDILAHVQELGLPATKADIKMSKFLGNSVMTASSTWEEVVSHYHLFRDDNFYKNNDIIREQLPNFKGSIYFDSNCTTQEEFNGYADYVSTILKQNGIYGEYEFRQNMRILLNQEEGDRVIGQYNYYVTISPD